MRTILVVFTNDKNKSVNSVNTGALKKYCFRVKDSFNVEVGTFLKSPAYTNYMLVTEVLNEDYKYVNHTSGELKKEITATTDFPIKTLEVKEQGDLTEFVSIVTD